MNEKNVKGIEHWVNKKEDVKLFRFQINPVVLLK